MPIVEHDSGDHPMIDSASLGSMTACVGSNLLFAFAVGCPKNAYPMAVCPNLRLVLDVWVSMEPRLDVLVLG